MEYILGIDIGTGSTKAVAVNLKGETLSSHQVYYDTSAPEPGFSEQDPEEIWLAFKTCLLSVFSELAVSPLAISIGTAMHSLILTGEDDELLSPMLTWADSRSADIASRIKSSDIAEDLYRHTGTPIHAMSPLCKLIWFREHQPALMEKAFKFLSIKEYIWHKLFDEYAIDYSIASSTGLFNIISLKWHSQALELAGVTEAKLSKLVATDYVRSGSELNDQTLIDFTTTHFVIGASDGCLANLGSFATEPGVAALTIGTSGAVRVASRTPIVNYPAMTFNYILDKEYFICGGPVNNGGSVIQWLLKNVFEESELTEEVYNQFFESISKVQPGSEGVVFLPYLSGERAPIWDSDSCGTFFGLRLRHSKPQLARAVLEGVCFALNDVLQVVQNSADAITQINISGGFVQSEVWMQMLADITGKKLVLVQKEDASAIGAVFLAAKTLHLDLSFAGTAPQSIIPNAVNHEHYRKIFPIFKELYHSLSPLMKKLQHPNL
jgi:gluconokinase